MHTKNILILTFMTIIVYCGEKVLCDENVNDNMYSFSINSFNNRTGDDLTIMKWFGKLFDQHDWTLRHLNKSNVGEQCRLDISNYLVNLHNGAVWALRSKSNYSI